MKIVFVSFCAFLCLVSLSCGRSFSLKDDRLIDKSARHDDGNLQIKQNPDGSYHITGKIMTTFDADGGTSQNVWADGVTHTWIGKVRYQNFVFDSDANKPLVFRVDKDNGYTYVSGKGTVTTPDGQVTSLP